MKVFSISPIGVLNDAAGRILGFFRPVRDLVRRKRAVGVSGKVVILWVSMWPERPGAPPPGGEAGGVVHGAPRRDCIVPPELLTGSADSI